MPPEGLIPGRGSWVAVGGETPPPGSPPPPFPPPLPPPFPPLPPPGSVGITGASADGLKGEETPEPLLLPGLL
ncbi:MAG TPA: hypothetical protein DCP71_02260 [Verrucomicrobiales bacterium]|nr:hypothetical protein [Verrucomicrobiales bacterium]